MADPTVADALRIVRQAFTKANGSLLAHDERKTAKLVQAGLDALSVLERALGEATTRAERAEHALREAGKQIDNVRSLWLSEKAKAKRDGGVEALEEAEEAFLEMVNRGPHAYANFDTWLRKRADALAKGG